MSLALQVKFPKGLKERVEVATVNTEPSLTIQSAAEAADINGIVARFERTGLLPQSERALVYLDVSEVGDYREALERVELANEHFRQLPAKVRARFENQPAVFLDFMADPANEAEALELGLLEKPAEPEKAKPEPQA